MYNYVCWVVGICFPWESEEERKKVVYLVIQNAGTEMLVH